MGIWRVVDHTPEDPGGPDSTSPTLLCHKPSIPLFPPPKAPVNEDHAVWKGLTGGAPRTHTIM
eukprot:scaffold92028_cov19-Tisochrysis_lutea.AAC.1